MKWRRIPKTLAKSNKSFMNYVFIKYWTVCYSIVKCFWYWTKVWKPWPNMDIAYDPSKMLFTRKIIKIMSKYMPTLLTLHDKDIFLSLKISHFLIIINISHVPRTIRFGQGFRKVQLPNPMPMSFLVLIMVAGMWACGYISACCERKFEFRIGKFGRHCWQ